jgi:uncharacterized membrane protein YfcA
MYAELTFSLAKSGGKDKPDCQLFGGTFMTWEILILGFGIGVISGIIGIGGGVLLIPALIWLLGMSQRKAQGTSLAALLLPVGIFAFWTYYREGNADLRVGLLVATGFAVGGLFGGWGAQYVPELWLRRIFAVTLIVLGTKMLFTKL